MGRATSIEPNKVVLEKGTIEYSLEDTLLIDCMVENLYGYNNFGDDFQIFEPGRINLGPLLLLFNPSLTSAMIAFLECKLKGDDAAKNACCYFPRGKYTAPIPEMFVGSLYLQFKTMEELKKVDGAMNFFMFSRTNDGSPIHQGGMLKMLWNVFGPKQGHRFNKDIIQKVETLGYSDVDHCFGAETFDNNKKEKTKACFCF